MREDVLAELAPHGVLRAGINLSNFLLVTGTASNGDPQGVAPDMAKAAADRLGVPVKYVPYPSPGEVADVVGQDIWDIGLVGAEPARAATIAFSPAYVEIESTYLVPAGSPITSITEVDKPGIRIAVSARTAYELWLTRNLQHAELQKFNGSDETFDRFVNDKFDVLAGLRTGLIDTARKLPGSRVLDGKFAAVQQAIGTAKANTAGAAFLREFVEEMKASGFVASLIERHNANGLSVAPAG